MSFVRPFLALVLALGFLSGPVYAAKSYYKWVDEDGVTHYTERKPNGQNSEAISVSTGLPRDDNGQPIQLEDQTGDQGAEGTQTAAAGSDAAEDPNANKDPERCEVAKKNLKIITENNRIREKDEKGNFRFLNPDEIDERKKAAEQAIKESC